MPFFEQKADKMRPKEPGSLYSCAKVSIEEVFRSDNELRESYACYQYCRHHGIVHTSQSQISNVLWSNLRLGIELLYIQSLKEISSMGSLISSIASLSTAVFSLRRLIAYSHQVHIGANGPVICIIFRFQTSIHPCRFQEEIS